MIQPIRPSPPASEQLGDIEFPTLPPQTQGRDSIAVRQEGCCIAQIVHWICGFFANLFGSRQTVRSQTPSPAQIQRPPMPTEVSSDIYEFQVGGTHVQLVKGDLLQQQVDVIVNAANEACLGGGGIDGIIHQAAGRLLLIECRLLPEARPGVRCPTGSAVITGSGNLLDRGIRNIIHTVGPVYSVQASENSQNLLASAYRSSLQLAKDNGLRKIAFPLISAGIFGYPQVDAARTAFETIRRFCGENSGSFDEVKLVIMDSNRFTTLYRELVGSLGLARPSSIN